MVSRITRRSDWKLKRAVWGRVSCAECRRRGKGTEDSPFWAVVCEDAEWAGALFGEVWSARCVFNAEYGSLELWTAVVVVGVSDQENRSRVGRGGRASEGSSLHCMARVGVCAALVCLLQFGRCVLAYLYMYFGSRRRSDTP
jgi:hypothetical protein